MNDSHLISVVMSVHVHIRVLTRNRVFRMFQFNSALLLLRKVDNCVLAHAINRFLSFKN